MEDPLQPKELVVKFNQIPAKMWKVVSSVADFWGDISTINPSTLSGAIDIVVVRGKDGELACSPFHVRFGKLVLLRPTEKKVVITVNETAVDIPMKVGEAGEAFFVVELDELEHAPSEYATSPIIKPATLFAEMPTESFDLGEASEPKQIDADNNSLPDGANAPEGEVIEDNGAITDTKKANMDPLENQIASMNINNEQELGVPNMHGPNYMPVGSPDWQWNWGGLPKKKESDQQENGASALADGSNLGTSNTAAATGMAGTTSDLSVEENSAVEGAMALNEKVPLPLASKAPVASSLTAALQKGTSTTAAAYTSSLSALPESTVIDVHQPSVTVGEKVDNYLSSFPDHMAPPDKPPSLRATSPSPMSYLDSRMASLSAVPLLSNPPDFTDLSAQFFELSLCGKSAIASALTAPVNPAENSDSAIESASRIFVEHQIDYNAFIADPSSIISNPNLIVRLKNGSGGYYDWSVIAPILISWMAFGKSLPEDEMHRLIQKSLRHHERTSNTDRTAGNGDGVGGMGETGPTSDEPRKYSSFGNLRSWWSRGAPAPASGPTTAAAAALNGANAGATGTSPPAEATAVAVPDIAVSASSPPHVAGSVDGAADGQSVDDEKSGAERRKYIKSLRMTSEQLKGLNLNKGVNTISFSVTSRLQGTAICTSKIFLWEHDTRVVISDVDGTITKSDVLGHVFTMVGQDWTHSGVASLYTNIRKNNYQILYLTSRAIGQANYTRDYLKKVDQDKFKLPEGPVVMSPDRLFTAFHREVIQRRPFEFKIACLRDIQRLFGPNARPFYAGFGNRITDVQSYRAVQVPLSRIFTIDPSGEIKLEFTRGYKSTYAKLNEIVERIFPVVADRLEHETEKAAREVIELEDGVEENDWEMWKQYLPEAYANMSVEAKKESGLPIDDDEEAAPAEVPSGTDHDKPGDGSNSVEKQGKDGEDEEYEEGEEYEEYEEEEEEVDGEALENMMASEDDETLRLRMAEMKKYKF
ncbi:phosphatidate phosphatase [Chytriomyces confervae]|uniref:phosphatidate phosphatase n=1 Tax=Chytriomyces confervae TaxID=246404 RepID=A0A507FDQ3_9FUNG|nr:phosphatidate phosphatase [Chytriomyces confervae]